jgi:hypothetical protein
MRRPLTRLSPDAPRLHRLVHELASWGLNHSEVCWKLAQALTPAPGDAGLLVNERHALRLNLAAQTEQRVYAGEAQNELLLTSRLVTPGGHGIDLAAHIGLYTVLMASRVGPSGRVLAYEPCAPVHDRLLAHTRELPQVTVLPRLETLSEAQGSAPIELLRLGEAEWAPQVFEKAPELFREHRLQSLLTPVGPGALPPRLLAPHFPLKEYAHFQVGERPSRTRVRRRPALAPVELQREGASRFTLLAIRRDCIGRIVDFLAR